jgi:hypothetical protein
VTSRLRRRVRSDSPFPGTRQPPSQAPLSHPADDQALAPSPYAVDDYEAFAARSQKRFRNRVLAALGALLAALFVPWAFRARGVLSEDTAGVISLVAAFLVLGTYAAVARMIADPKRTDFSRVMAAAIGVPVVIVVLAFISFGVGWIGGTGLVMTFILLFFCGGMFVRGLITRGIRASGDIF